MRGWNHRQSRHSSERAWKAHHKIDYELLVEKLLGKDTDMKHESHVVWKEDTPSLDDSRSTSCITQIIAELLYGTLFLILRK